MKISDIRDLRGMDDEEARAYLHELVDFIVDEGYTYHIEHGNVSYTTINGESDGYYGVNLKAVFHSKMIFNNEKGWIPA